MFPQSEMTLFGPASTSPMKPFLISCSSFPCQIIMACYALPVMCTFYFIITLSVFSIKVELFTSAQSSMSMGPGRHMFVERLNCVRSLSWTDTYWVALPFLFVIFYFYFCFLSDSGTSVSEGGSDQKVILKLTHSSIMILENLNCYLKQNF